jgi:hypothetical protein
VNGLFHTTRDRKASKLFDYWNNLFAYNDGALEARTRADQSTDTAVVVVWMSCLQTLTARD